MYIKMRHVTFQQLCSAVSVDGQTGCGTVGWGEGASQFQFKNNPI